MIIIHSLTTLSSKYTGVGGGRSKAPGAGVVIGS